MLGPMSRCPPRDLPIQRPNAADHGDSVYGFIKQKTNAEVLSAVGSIAIACHIT
jgi:hypothetical protein